MRTISSDFADALEDDNRAYLERATITLADETVLSITNANLWQNGFSFEDSVSSDNSFQVGAAIINKCTLVLNNIYGTYDSYDFVDATVLLRIGLTIDDADEIITIGNYTVVDNPTYNGSLITLECLDNMYKFDQPYSESSLTYPATVDDIVTDACSCCGVSWTANSFPNNTLSIETRPDDENLTFREIISYCAQIACCFARCNTSGYLDFAWYDQDALEDAQESESEISGVHYISSLYSEQISNEDITITGAKVVVDVEEETTTTVDDETVTTVEYNTYEYKYGTDGYVISIENNPLINTTIGQTVADTVGGMLRGFTFRTAELSHSSDPSIEAGDVAIVTDRNENQYPIVISSTKFSSGNAQNTTCSAEEITRHNSSRVTVETKNYATIRGLLASNETDALLAQSYANIAREASEEAQELLDEMEEAAENAGTTLTQIYQDAVDAASAAASAQTSADNAQADATTANTAANSALTQLSTIEDVAGMLDWITEHGSYALTEDTSVIAGKLYYERTDTYTLTEDTAIDADKTYYELDDGEYVEVENPDVSDIGSYYELTSTSYTLVTNLSEDDDPSSYGYYELDSVDEAIGNYVSTHLALTDDGLYLIMDDSGYKLKLTSDGAYICNPSGEYVAQYGTTAVIGSESAAHVEITDSALNFCIGSEVVAYAAVDPDTGESTFYMTKAIVVQDLYFGYWQWKSRSNNNLALKWIGADT